MCRKNEVLTNDKDIKLISDHFDLALSEEELSEFEQRIFKDSDFYKKVRWYGESNALVRYKYLVLGEHDRIQRWNSLILLHKRSKSNEILKRLVWSAVAIFTVFFLGWKMYCISTPNMVEIAIEEAWSREIGLNYTLTRSSYTGKALEKNIDVAYAQYIYGEYELAIRILSDFDSSKKYYEDAVLLQGLSYHKLGNSEKALQVLQLLLEYPTCKKAEVALWYIGLIHLENGEVEKAKRFIELSSEGGFKIKMK